MKLSDIDLLIVQQRTISRLLDQMVFENSYDKGDNEDAILEAYEQSQKAAELLIALSKQMK